MWKNIKCTKYEYCIDSGKQFIWQGISCSTKPIVIQKKAKPEMCVKEVLRKWYSGVLEKNTPLTCKYLYDFLIVRLRT